MKTIEETYPDQVKESESDGYFWAPGDYNPMLQSFEYEILLQVDDSDYQGDSRLIFRNGDQYGLLIFGWGSCSGCDALQGCDSMKEIAELRDSLHGQIRWDSLRGLHDYITNKDWELDYSWHADETKDFVEKAKVLLGNLLENVRVDAPAVASPNLTRDAIAGCIPRLVRPVSFGELQNLLGTRPNQDVENASQEWMNVADLQNR